MSYLKNLYEDCSCLLVNTNSCGELILSSELPIIFDDNLNTAFVFISHCSIYFIKLRILLKLLY